MQPSCQTLWHGRPDRPGGRGCSGCGDRTRPGPDGALRAPRLVGRFLSLSAAGAPVFLRVSQGMGRLVRRCRETHAPGRGVTRAHRGGGRGATTRLRVPPPSSVGNRHVLGASARFLPGGRSSGTALIKAAIGRCSPCYGEQAQSHCCPAVPGASRSCATTRCHSVSSQRGLAPATQQVLIPDGRPPRRGELHEPGPGIGSGSHGYRVTLLTGRRRGLGHFAGDTPESPSRSRQSAVLGAEIEALRPLGGADAAQTVTDLKATD